MLIIEVKKKLIKDKLTSFVSNVIQFSVKNAQLLKHRITVLCTEGGNRV